MNQNKESEQYLHDMKDWQRKQYLPGAYTGSDMPFPVKQFGKKKWFRTYSLIYVIVFAVAVIYGLIQMVLYVVKQ